MKMKKRTILAVALIFVMVIFSGCSGNDDGDEVSEPPVVEAPLTIAGQTTTFTATVGEEAALSVTVEGDDEGLSYQWFQTADPVNRNSDDIQIIGNEAEFIPPASEGGRAIAGANDSTYLAPTEVAGVNSYYVEISNDIETIVSDAITVAVKSTDTVEDAADPLNILFICGGNTGRSPMAKVITEEIFAEKGVPAVFTSAGSDIIDGDPAEENAVILMAERGLDLSDHIAQWWTPEMLEDADYVFVMTESHKNRVNVATLGIYEDKIFLLREFVGDSGGVPDPFEEPMEAYIETADILTDAAYKLADMLGNK